jgi:hypothetical protein
MFKKRFSNMYSYDHLFTSIRKAADNFLSDAIEGQTATLCVDFSSCNVYIKDENGWDY